MLSFHHDPCADVGIHCYWSGEIPFPLPLLPQLPAATLHFGPLCGQFNSLKRQKTTTSKNGFILTLKLANLPREKVWGETQKACLGGQEQWERRSKDRSEQGFPLLPAGSRSVSRRAQLPWKQVPEVHRDVHCHKTRQSYWQTEALWVMN